jgi:CRISPR-associated endonuclease/helicase Cas3
MTSRIPPSAWWGKRTPHEGAVEAWHPLSHHCADVAAVLWALLGGRGDGALGPSLMRRRLAALAGVDDLDACQVARLVVLAALHDLGKYNHGFQAKREEQRGPHWAGHVSEAMAIIVPDSSAWWPHLSQALDLPLLNTWGSALTLLCAAISHHGRPAEIPHMLPAQLDPLWAPRPERDPFAGITALVADTKRWLPEAWTGTSPLPDVPAFQHGFCGLVQLADWLGSDTGFFPYSTEDEGDRWPIACAAAERALAATRLDPTVARAHMADAGRFASISDAPTPRPMQTAVGSLTLPPGPSLTIIEEETGGGKTEAALWHFVRLFAVGLVDGVYVALPTRTAATQIYHRFEIATKRCFPHADSRPAVIQAVPGYLGADGATGTRLPGFEVLWNDDPTRARRHERWAAEAPKRYLAGCIVVGTIDQVLLSTLAVGHAHLRAACLLRLLVVVDEVHASDAYMTRLLTAVLERTRAAGGHALLMSATLGATARDAYLKAWTGSKTSTTRSAAEAVPYPALSVAGQPVQAVERTGRDRQVALNTMSAMDPTAIAARALAAAQAGARVLIIRNTVRGCLEVQSALEAADQPALLWRLGDLPVPHHARYARDDRMALDQALEQVFGKHAKRDGGRIACATQTVQQALDLDADWMITDLAPVDVLLQRFGRLHRHERTRPVGYATPAALVLVPEDSCAAWLGAPERGPHGWGTVYSDLRVLESTRRLLAEGVWAIPQDNRRLVESATHPEALAALDPDEPRWAIHGGKVVGATVAQRQQAGLGLLPDRIGFDDDGVCFPSGDLAPEIRTRLGEDNRRCAITPPLRSPLGTTLHELVFPARWCRGIPGDVDPAFTVHDDHLLITWHDRRFRYDRLGLRPET